MVVVFLQLKFQFGVEFCCFSFGFVFVGVVFWFFWWFDVEFDVYCCEGFFEWQFIGVVYVVVEEFVWVVVGCFLKGLLKV